MELRGGSLNLVIYLTGSKLMWGSFGGVASPESLGIGIDSNTFDRFGLSDACFRNN
jgi:hypothetical protein